MSRFIKENLEEFTIGFVLGLGFLWAIGWYSLLLGLWTGVLWRLGGMGYLGTKAWRRFGVPVVILVGCGIPLSVASVIGTALTAILLTVGYGSKDVNDQVGSPLGNFWPKVSGEHAGKWLARLTILVGIWAVWAICLSF